MADPLNNLRPINSLPRSEFLALAAQGGRGNEETGIRKSLARQIDWMKRKNMTDETIQQMMDMMENPNASSVNILQLIQEFKEAQSLKGALEPKHYAQLQQMYAQWHKINHGEKHQINSTNLNINVSLAEMERRLMDDPIIDIPVASPNDPKSSDNPRSE